MRLSRLCATTAALLALLTTPALGADLLDVYKQALGSDPLLREADANRMVAMESRPQARSTLLPQLSLSANSSNQSQDGVRPEFNNDPMNPDFIGIPFNSDTDQTSLTLQLTQTVFRWDQWLALRQSDKIVAQADVDYKSVEQGLLLRVAERYFDVLSARDDLESSRANKDAIARQLEQSETRFEVGLIAITDVQESRAAFDQSVASEIQAKRLLATARENLRELTGAYIEDLENPDASLPLALPVPADEDAWVERALDQNLNLLSSRLGVQIAKDTINVQRAGHMPTLDLVVQRNEFQDDSTFGNSSTATRDTTTDLIQLQLNVPLFGGGRVSSQVREAVYQHRASRERLERVARETERETRDAFLGVSSDISTIKALEQALTSAQTALKATEAGFDVGTRTTVDVLDARRDLFSAQTNLERSRYNYIINLLRLKQAAGTLDAQDLVQINGWLN